MPPMMMTGSTQRQTGRRTVLRACFAPASRRGMRAISRLRAQATTRRPSATPIITPGTMPARNSREIDTPPATPKTMIADRRRDHRRDDAAGGDQSGRARHVVAGVAHDRDQHRGERRRVGDRRAGHAREQDRGDHRDVAQPAADVADQAWPTSTRRRERPPAFIGSPASRKNGTASSGKLSAPSTICAMSCESKVRAATSARRRQHSSAKAIGMPRAIAPSSEVRKIDDGHAGLTRWRAAGVRQQVRRRHSPLSRRHSDLSRSAPMPPRTPAGGEHHAHRHAGTGARSSMPITTSFHVPCASSRQQRAAPHRPGSGTTRWPRLGRSRATRWYMPRCALSCIATSAPSSVSHMKTKREASSEKRCRVEA